MDAVIPANVLEHLRKLAEEQTVDPLRGGFTQEQYANALGLSPYKASKDIKRLFRAGHIQPRTVGLTLSQSLQMGYTRACSTTVYHLVDDAK